MTIEPLGGGITNHNFRVDVGDETFVLRIGGQDTELLGIERFAEHAASLVAAELGLAPGVVAFLEPEGYLVTRYVAGVVGKVDVAQVGAALRRLHDGPAIPSRFDSFRVVEGYRAIAEERGIGVPAAHDWASELAGRIEERRRGEPPRPCHNDLLNANFIADGDRLWIVDWEYAGMGDPFFDLGNFAVNHELDAEGERLLLETYGGGDHRGTDPDAFHVGLPRGDVGRRPAGDLELDFDFRAYADEHFERLERTAAEPRFRAALG